MKNLILVWFGVILTFISTILTFAMSPTPLPLADKIWLVGMCIVVVLVLVATYMGRPRNLARPPSPAVRLLALLVMVVSGGTWLWHADTVHRTSDGAFVEGRGWGLDAGSAR